jgi:hypothetical protein
MNFNEENKKKLQSMELELKKQEKIEKDKILFAKGKIYGIYNKNGVLRYIGSTPQELSARWRDHKGDTKKLNKTADIFKEMRELGIENFYIELIENWPCNNRDELRQREGYWQRQNWDNIANMKIECRTRQERESEPEFIIKKNEYSKKHRKENPEMYKAYDKKRSGTEPRLEWKRNDYAKNPEKKIQQSQEYRDKVGSIKIKCNCGLIVRTDGLSKHKKKQIHFDVFNIFNNKEKKEPSNEKMMICECGLETSIVNIKRHKNTEIHDEIMKIHEDKKKEREEENEIIG